MFYIQCGTVVEQSQCNKRKTVRYSLLSYKRICNITRGRRCNLYHSWRCPSGLDCWASEKRQVLHQDHWGLDAWGCEFSGSFSCCFRYMTQQPLTPCFSGQVSSGFSCHQGVFFWWNSVWWLNLLWLLCRRIRNSLKTTTISQICSRMKVAE